MELDTVSELARQKFYLHLTFCHVPVSVHCQGEEPRWLSCLTVAVGWGGARALWQQQQLHSCCPLCCSAGLWQEHKCSPVGDDWLFPISLERHTAVSVAQSNKVWAGKKWKKPLLIMKGRSGKGFWQSLYNPLYKKQNENKCLYVLWSKNVKAEVNSLLLI